MKIVAVSDHFVRDEHYEACFAKYPEYELKTIFFGTEDRIEMRDIFHTIERNGPEAWPIPDELYEAILYFPDPIGNAACSKSSNY